MMSAPLDVKDALLPSAVWAIAMRDLRHPAATRPAQVQLSPADAPGGSRREHPTSPWSLTTVTRALVGGALSR